MNLGKTLKNERNKKQLTQEQLAEKIFVSTKTISNWETGKTTPDIDSLIRLANLFNLSLDNILLEGSEIVKKLKHNEEVSRLRRWRFFSTQIVSICIIILIATGQFLKMDLQSQIIFCVISLATGISNIYFVNEIYKIQTEKIGEQTVMQFICAIISLITSLLSLYIGFNTNNDQFYKMLCFFISFIMFIGFILLIWGMHYTKKRT